MKFFNKVLAAGLLIDGKESSKSHVGYTREASLLKKKEEKTCLCKRYALIWDISSANPPFLIVITSVDLVKNLVEVFLKGYLG